MPQRLRVVALSSLSSLFALTAPVSAQSVVAFHADFDQDTVGQAPSSSPPGLPDGDSILLATGGGTILVESASGAMTDQPLEFTRSLQIAGFYFVGRLDPSYVTCDSYVISFRGMLRANTFYTYITARTSTGQVIGAIEYRSAGVISYNGSQNPVSDTWSTEIPQDFVLTLDRVAQTASLSIDGVPMPEVQDRAATIPDLAAVQVQFGGTGILDRFVLDDLHVEATGCTSPVEGSTWGRIKSAYR